MPKAIQVNIPEPCHENWQQMTPNEQGRHCMSCQKTVVDFSVMSDKEILNYISNASSQVCGRFANDQLNKDMVIEKKKKFSFVYVWNLLIATFLVTGKAYTQGGPILKKEVVVKNEPVVMMGAVAFGIEPKATIVPPFVAGQVLNINDKTPVSGATITIVGTKKGTVAERDGSFHVNWRKKNKSALIEISAIGYKTKVIDVALQTNWMNLEVLMDPEAVELDTVVVNGPGYETTCRTTMGAGSYIIYETAWEKTKKEFADWLRVKKEVQVFPNPTIKGSAINLKLNLKETGEYKMELMDASGRVVLVRPVVVTVKEQSASIPTNISWSTGIYWLRLTGKHTKKTYQSKVLIQ